MATATTIQNPSHTAKTIIFDLSSKTLNFEPSYPIPTPDPAKNDYLIHVKATALCARELEWPFEYPEAIFSDNPDKQITPGYDLAGVVVTSPSPDAPFQPGDEIYARTLPNRPGNCREYTIGRPEEMALKPSSLDWVQSATVPLSALTAWQALFEHGGVKSEAIGDPNVREDKKRVLVIAAAGGVGVWVVQLASLAGLEVVAQIGSVENDQYVRELGATETINYKELSLKQWAEKKGQVDIVIDLLGGQTLADAWHCVKDGGTLISIVEQPEARKPETGWKGKDVKSLFFIMHPDGQQLTEISKLLDQGKCRPVLDSVWKLEACEKAFERLNGGHAKGKIVIKIAE